MLLNTMKADPSGRAV